MLKPPDMAMYEYIHNALAPVRDIRAAIQLKTDGALPDTFLIYYLVSGNPQGHFSGRYTRENERYSVCVYDRNKSGIEAADKPIKAAMEKAGFLYITKSADLFYKDTGHWARTIDFRYYEEV